MNKNKRKLVLIVEDQPDIRKLIELTLDIGDYELHQAENGESALHMIKAMHPSLVLLDVMMPGSMDGFQLCERIKSDPLLARIRVVMLTARSQQRDFEMGRKVGADAYLTKPFSPIQLLDTVEKMLT